MTAADIPAPTPPDGAGRRLLALAAKVLFFAYVLTCVVAGIWGVFGARLDFPILLRQPMAGLDPEGMKDVLSQYRFLRAIEAGFGLFALRFRAEIFTTPTFNRMFLWWMGFGIVGRLVGLVFEGIPGPVALVALGGEAAGLVAIFLDTRAVRAGPPGASSASREAAAHQAGGEHGGPGPTGQVPGA